MHDDLWAGVELKYEHAEFFLERMAQALAPMERTSVSVVQQTSGAIVGMDWQRLLYANIDAFLAMSRSIPEIINACFGKDSMMGDWLKKREADEQQRRSEFTRQFKAGHKRFRELPLSTQRNIILHRTGVASVEVNITGRFGLSYLGTPLKRLLHTETKHIATSNDPSLEWAGTLPPLPVRPIWTDCTIDGKPLFSECGAYLQKARELITEAHTIATKVHGGGSLTFPPA